jgi:hypothetical protein
MCTSSLLATEARSLPVVGQYRSVAGDRFPAVSLERMKPTTSDAGQSPLLLFQDLLATLCAEGGQNWAPGVQAIVQALTPPFASEQEHSTQSQRRSAVSKRC